MADVEEKGLDHELAHSDIHRGRLVPIGTAEVAPAPAVVEVASVPTPAPVAEVTPETQSQGKRKKLGRRADSASEDAQDDPAAD